MRFLQAINPMTWVNKAIDKRIREWKGGTHMEYNPLLAEMTHVDTSKQFTKRMLECSVLYSGNEQDIAYFYRKEAPKFYRKGEPSESLNYFWAQTDSEIRRVHMGTPQLISEKMVDLIIGNGYTIKVEGKNEEEIQKDLDEALDDNKFNQILGDSIETESWSGGVSWKLSYNPTISEYPIIQKWEPENYTCDVVAGRVVRDIFYVYYKKGNRQFRLSEIYGVDDDGSYIDYRLQELVYKQQAQQSTGAEWMPANLTDLEETADLQRITIKGYFKRLSLYKPNKTPNNEFRHSKFGQSDYAGSYSGFDSLDEIGSTWIQEFRDGKLNRYFPEELMIKSSSGEYNYPSDFKNKHTLYADSPSENVDKQKILYEQGDVRTEKHVESWKIWMTNVLNNAGLSPLTVGATGLESISASEQSQQEREKVSIRTRNKKIGLWTEFLNDFLLMYVEFRAMTKNLQAPRNGLYSVKSLPDVKVLVTFEDYIVKSKRDRTEEVQQGLGSSWDVLTAVKYVHDDMTEREQLALSARIKLENGYNSISTAEASALQDENLETQEILQGQGIEIIEVNPVEDDVVIDENDDTPPPEDQ